MVGRKRKNSNPNPVPRKKLPDLDAILSDYQSTISKVCMDLKKTWFQQIYVPELKDEIKQTVMLIFYIEWDRYRNGMIDEFPPSAGYLYVSSRYMMWKQYAPQGDILRHVPIDVYNSVEPGQGETELSFTGNLIIVDPLYKEIATQEQNLPRRDEKDPDDYFGDYPDIIDFWWLGFSVNELAVIYGIHHSTVRARLHDYYDAMEANGAKIFRRRVGRRKRKKRSKFVVK